MYLTLATTGLSAIFRVMTEIHDHANYLLLFGEVAFAFSMGLSPISFMKNFATEWNILPQRCPSNPDLSDFCQEGKERTALKEEERRSSNESSPGEEEGRSASRSIKAKENIKAKERSSSSSSSKNNNEQEGEVKKSRKKGEKMWCIGVRAGALMFCALATFVCKVILPCICLADSSPDLSYFTDLFDMRGFKSTTILLCCVSFFCLFTVLNEHFQFLRKQFPVGVDPLLKIRFARTYDFFLFVIGALLVPSALGVVTNQIGGVFFYAIIFFISCIVAAITYVSIISPIIIRYNLECHRTAYTKRNLILSLLFIIPIYAFCGFLQNWYPIFATFQFITNCVLGCMLTLILLSYCQWAAQTDTKLPIISFRNLIGRSNTSYRTRTPMVHSKKGN